MTVLKRLFGFIGRGKRIAQKMCALGRCIELMTGRNKIDFALELAEEVAQAKNNRELEEIADFYLMEVPKSL